MGVIADDIFDGYISIRIQHSVLAIDQTIGMFLKLLTPSKKRNK